MKQFFFKSLLLLLAAGYENSLFAQSPRESSIEQMRALLDLYLHPAVNINKLPINICFIRDGTINTGIIIAGHANHNVCRLASLRIKNLFDSMEYRQNTIFSFGVGYDRRWERDAASYDQALDGLEKVFRDVQEQHPLQLHVTAIQDSVIQSLAGRIKRNAALAFSTLKANDSINRIIFRYDSISFPLPTPFYDENGVVSFTIPKAAFGNIPGARVYDPALFDSALAEIADGLRINSSALERLNGYDPVARDGYPAAEYSIAYYLNGKVNRGKFVTYDPGKLLRVFEEGTNRHRRYYSLADLKNNCERGVRYLPERSEGGKLISPCEQLHTYQSNVSLFREAKDMLLQQLPQVNRSLALERSRILAFRDQFRQPAGSSENAILIDGFLRGWAFRGSTAAMDNQLDTWYQRRKAVWQNVLARYPAFRNRVTGIKEMEPPKTLKEGESPRTQFTRIAGVFHDEDVFFSVKEEGDHYKIVPYKMVTGKFIQVIDRKHAVSQLFTDSNFRLISL